MSHNNQNNSNTNDDFEDLLVFVFLGGISSIIYYFYGWPTAVKVLIICCAVCRLKAFKKYQVNKNLMKFAKKSAIFMHCLPAYRGFEVTSEVIDGPQSVVYQEAENRLHVQKALILLLLNKI